jgi:uncharacterized FlaG/YvyC family protein
MYDAKPPIDAVRAVPVGNESISQIEQLKQVSDLVRAVQALNRFEMNSLTSGKRYSLLIDREARRTVVRVLDQDTGDTLYQIPPEEVLRRAAEIRRRSRSYDAEIVDGFEG